MQPQTDMVVRRSDYVAWGRKIDNAAVTIINAHSRVSRIRKFPVA